MKVYLVSFIFVFSLMVTLQMPAGAGIRMKIGSLHGMAERGEQTFRERLLQHSTTNPHKREGV